VKYKNNEVSVVEHNGRGQVELLLVADSVSVLQLWVASRDFACRGVIHTKIEKERVGKMPRTSEVSARVV
jgi:hypothetical protein